MLTAVSSAGVFVSIGIGAPPPIPLYEQPVCPAPNFIWIPGYWAYGPYGYFWVPGTWVLAPEPGYLWTPGYWAFGGGGYGWHPGYWGLTVGFYGGVNYGYGYTGYGYSGGYWNHGAFYYNRAANNVNVVNIHNTYNTTIINREVNRVSYNGGQGGVQARATASELAAERGSHIQPTGDQMRHEEMARDNRDFRASVNHGNPAIGATARPAEFGNRANGESNRRGAAEHATANRSAGYEAGNSQAARDQQRPDEQQRAEAVREQGRNENAQREQQMQQQERQREDARRQEPAGQSHHAEKPQHESTPHQSEPHSNGNNNKQEGPSKGHRH